LLTGQAVGRAGALGAVIHTTCRALRFEIVEVGRRLVVDIATVGEIVVEVVAIITSPAETRLEIVVSATVFLNADVSDEDVVRGTGVA
jgi:hypothetical protein